jgi:hypothetical protein
MYIFYIMLNYTQKIDLKRNKCQQKSHLNMRRLFVYNPNHYDETKST